MTAAAGLQRCTLVQPSGLEGDVEIVIAPRAWRTFALRSSPDLGVIVKDGGPHEVMSDGRRLVVPRNAIILRPPGCVWSMADAYAGFVSIDIGPAQLPERATYGPMSFPAPVDRPLLDRVMAVLQRPVSRLQATEAIAALIEMLFANGFASCRRQRDENPRTAAVRRAREFLDASESADCTLADVARVADLNKFVLLRHFKRVVGTSPHAYQLQRRVSRGRALLARGRRPSDVAAETGWADQSHFGRHFKRSVGLSPRTYARAVRSAPPGHVKAGQDQRANAGPTRAR